MIGPRATESAFKRLPRRNMTSFTSRCTVMPAQRSEIVRLLVLLSDPAAGEDGFLQASEIVQLPLNSDLVILSACDTAIGPMEGEEGIAALSGAFLLAGARSVVSTLWSIDDTFSLFLMKQFYKHLASHEPPAVSAYGSKARHVAEVRRGGGSVLLGRVYAGGRSQPGR